MFCDVRHNRGHVTCASTSSARAHIFSRTQCQLGGIIWRTDTHTHLFPLSPVESSSSSAPAFPPFGIDSKFNLLPSSHPSGPSIPHPIQKCPLRPFPSTFSIKGFQFPIVWEMRGRSRNFVFSSTPFGVPSWEGYGGHRKTRNQVVLHRWARVGSSGGDRGRSVRGESSFQVPRGENSFLLPEGEAKQRIFCRQMRPNFWFTISFYLFLARFLKNVYENIQHFAAFGGQGWGQQYGTFYSRLVLKGSSPPFPP